MSSNTIYKHKHHIVPRHAGGTDDPSNLIELTIEEHAEAHRALYEQYGRWQDRIAWQTLSGQISSYEAARQARREANLGNKHFEGKTHTEETRKKISEFQKKAKIGTKHREGKTFTDESKNKISEGLKGNSNKTGKTGNHTWTEDGLKKRKERMSGENNPAKNPEVREKLKQAALKREARKRELKEQNAQ